MSSGPAPPAPGDGRQTSAATGSPPSDLPAGALTLHAFAGDEGPVLHRLVVSNLEHLRPWMPWAQGAPSEEANVEFVHRTIDEWGRGAGFGYWIGEEATGEMVGCAGLHARTGRDALEIGYWVSADRVRRGYATASARALTSAAFDLRGIERVEIHCDEANVASAGVPRRLGFRLDRIEDVAPGAPSETGRRMVWAVEAAGWVRPSS